MFMLMEESGIAQFLGSKCYQVFPKPSKKYFFLEDLGLELKGNTKSHENILRQ